MRLLNVLVKLVAPATCCCGMWLWARTDFEQLLLWARVGGTYPFVPVLASFFKLWVCATLARALARELFDRACAPDEDDESFLAVTKGPRMFVRDSLSFARWFFS
jgi:hypothetical protein